MTQVVKHLLSKHEALSSSLETAKKKKSSINDKGLLCHIWVI
jgi:hypothetical protein